MTTFTLTGFASHLNGLRGGLGSHTHHALEQAARIVEAEAKREIGHKQGQAGPFAAWEDLAYTTVNGFAGHPGKAALGHTPPDYDPLYRDGDMRDSIEHTIVGDVAHVGSNSQVAVWQELGTVNIPPRSFLGGAAVRKKDEIGKRIGRDVHMILSGKAVGHDVEIP